MAFRPYSPNDNSPPRHALPLRRPRICFRYFTFFGINIVLFSLPLHAWARPRQVQQSCPCSLLLRHCCSFAFVLNLRSALRNVFALIDPALHANHPVRRVRLREAEIDVRAQRLQRQPPLQVPFFARDFSAIQTPRHAHFDPLAAETQRRIHRFAHCAAKGHALFELQRNRLRHQLRVEFRTVHFLNVDVHFALGALLHFLQLLAQFHVFVKQIGIVLVGIPPGLPRLVVAQPESVRVRLLSHDSPYFLPLFGGACLPVNALRTRRAVPRTPFCASASA